MSKYFVTCVRHSFRESSATFFSNKELLTFSFNSRVLHYVCCRSFSLSITSFLKRSLNSSNFIKSQSVSLTMANLSSTDADKKNGNETFQITENQPETVTASIEKEKCEHSKYETSKTENASPLCQTMSKRALKKWRKKQIEANCNDGLLTTNPRPGYGADVLNETEYYFENNLRKVYPYYYTFNSHVKGRWKGRTLMDVFVKEFHVVSEQSLIDDMKNGLLLVNNKPTVGDYQLKFNDVISHTIHRHENPVVGTQLEILEDNEDLIVINKPSSIPCHPCGRYRYNSIVFILGKEYGYSNLRNIYRLDRLTSGVLICAKTAKKTRELEDQIINKKVRKEYVCRVVGRFPDGDVEVDQPLDCINHKISLWQVRPGGKESKTLFSRLSYNGKSSVVRCIPYTGRTHQLRVHLQYLGHPIINDPLYYGPAWGPEAGKGTIFQCKIDDTKISDEVMKNHNIGLWENGPNPNFELRLKQLKEEKSVASDHEDTIDEVKNTEPAAKRLKTSDQPEKLDTISNTEIFQPEFDLKKWIPNENCIHCKTLYLDPQPKDLVMYLHALSYKGPDWEYRTILPDWAAPDWQE
ncbi:pseudouridylate synthase RPUSD2 isoform X1 [Octopus bimaculoides]|uniref:Pseudouridine synthase RsuA/RluA-like domain-containing protein n=1 Tax=Octopus bimaculoides TaxID=37653 RepID=A0A0L8FL13_OCTBM|nr:pseudouridylate synthase RPUSD2 isoform X1 [Octopus bimaculoides]|eukprot:XP_014788872.1 PREDICTED: RNA pseudouridylate synthase domain-containing protein 2-like isoform X1 [Octopus bimaculoides]